MFKKITLLLMLSFSMLLHAEEAWVTAELEGRVLIINASSEGGKEGKDWVGVYKVGTSTAWKNVKGWTWLEDKPQIHVDDLAPGDYEARLFYNNSYKMEAKQAFTIEPPRGKPYIYLNENTGNAAIEVYTSVAPKAWIGIYPVGSSTSWSNVKSWKWAEKDGTTTIPVAFLKRGKYEARLFYYNSYKVEAKLTFETVGSGAASAVSPLRDIYNHSSISIDKRKVIFSNYNARDKKAWVGVYKKGAQINAQNLIAKGVLKQDNKKSWTYFKDTNGHSLSWRSYDMVYHPTSNFSYVGERKELSLAPGVDF